ncbi:hypothetical protein GCM10023094_32150 [Rhodococcus olei]|uniref:MFS transporter n=1 Tax=Rhodococcus olei TaxID=2161675 RepID=A0ABP8P6R8_9NOCA
MSSRDFTLGRMLTEGSNTLLGVTISSIPFGLGRDMDGRQLALCLGLIGLALPLIAYVLSAGQVSGSVVSLALAAMSLNLLAIGVTRRVA